MFRHFKPNAIYSLECHDKFKSSKTKQKSSLRPLFFPVFLGNSGKFGRHKNKKYILIARGDTYTGIMDSLHLLLH